MLLYAVFQCNYGVVLRKRKRRTAYYWFEKAALKGNNICLTYQALCLMDGRGIKADENRAIEILKQAAEKNEFNALIILGNCYEKGYIVEKDIAKAGVLYNLAAKQPIKNPENMGNTILLLASAFKKGTCVVQDLSFAEKCFDYFQSNYRFCLDELEFPFPLKKKFWIHLTTRQQDRATIFKLKNTIDVQTREMELLHVSVNQLSAENMELRNALVQYQESISKAYTAWSNTNATAQNDADYFALCEKISRKAAESQQTEYEKSAQALKERFGDYWERLQPDSRTGLVSARTLYELSTQQNTEDFDFSGVCISATSALENELKKVFLIDYIKFVKKNTLVVDSWPEALRYWSSDSQKWLAKDRFTLGDLPYLLEVKHKTGSEMLNCYLKNILNANDRKANDPRKPFTTSKNGKKSFVSRVDDLRDRYRNPAGHAGAVNVQTAESCLTQIMGSLEAKTRLNATESLIVELFDILK